MIAVLLPKTYLGRPVWLRANLAGNHDANPQHSRSMQATLDYQSSFVNFEALQLARLLTDAETVGLRGDSIVALPTPAPRRLFPGGGAGFRS